MKSWRFHEFGDLNNLRLEDVPVPDPKPGEALVTVEFAALNPADAFLVKGQYPRPGRPPFSVGRDGVGTIARATDGGRLKRGERVIVLRSDIGVTRDGTLAEQVAVPEESLAPLPDGWTPEEGAAAPLVFLTAWQALVEVGGIPHAEANPSAEVRWKSQPTVLITGASGGVGTAAVLLAKALECRVVALSRSEEKRAALRDLGADVVLDSEDPKLVESARKALDGGRADVVVENLGGPYLQKCIDMSGERGRIAVVGLLAGLTSEIQVPLLLFKRIRIEGVTVGAYTPAEAQQRWRWIVEALDRGKARPPIDRVFPMEQVPQAFERLAEGPLGKVLVRFAG